VRPLLVLTLIIAMLGFGGILIVRALFAPESFDKISERFRLAREIFLVFAGTFSTIVGFYFGSETNKDEDGGAPTVQLSYAGTNVVATIAEGTAPFIAIYTAAGAPGGNVVQSNDRALIFPAGATCPENATVLVVDGRGRQTTGTVTCPAPGGTGTPPDNTANGAANASVTNGAAPQ
jgi:hypothetical protein